MVSRENKNNASAKFRGTNKEYCGIFRTGLLTRGVPAVDPRSSFKDARCLFGVEGKHKVWYFKCVDKLLP